MKCPYNKKKCQWFNTKTCDHLRGGKDCSYAMCILHPMLGGKL